MANVITSIVQSQAQAVGKLLKHPRRGVDDQGRSVQFLHIKGGPFLQILLVVFGIVFIFVGIGLYTETLGSTADTDRPIGGIMFWCFAVGVFYGAYVSYRMTHVWYYEDEYGFEILTPVLHKKVSIAYNDIASWFIDGQRGLQIKTHSKQKATIQLPYFRPLILLDTLVTMEIEGRFGPYSSEEQRNKAIWTLDSEFCEHANKVVEEMQKTGATIYIPEHK